jgi:Omp85 superfamily domain
VSAVRFACCLGLAAASLLPAAAAAADRQPADDPAPATRAEAWRRLRAEKSTHLDAYAAKGVEKFAIRFEDNILPRLVTPRSGLYPFVGRITPGGGFAVGPGLRLLDVAGGQWTTYAAASIKSYWQIESRLLWPHLAKGRAYATTYGRFYRFPQEDFYGIGPDSDRANRSDFDMRQGTVGGGAGFRLRPWLTVGGGADVFRPRVFAGGDNQVPNAGEIFEPDELPGATDRHTFVSADGFADLRTAEPAFNPRRGGRYRVGVSRVIDTSAAPGFTRVDVDLQQYASVLNERRVFVLRALGSFTDVPDDGILPFYLMRTLGGSSTLRGFRDFRFRDRHLLALQAEYRFEIFTALDGALFYDAGQVAPSLDRFRWRDFERDWGFGFRFGGNGGVFLRLDLAYGGEGPRTWLRFGHVF